jgi:RNA polymerase sigma factor (sigma-70 family)
MAEENSEEEAGDDFVLLAAWRAGDPKAGETLFERHFETMARFFRNKVAAHAFEDLVQQTFLACVEAKDRFAERSSFRTYVFGVAHNVLRVHYRAKKKDNDNLDFGSVSMHDLAPQQNTMLAKRAEEELMLQGLRRLPMQDQVILELYLWEDMRAVDIAEALDMPEGTVRTRVRRARIKLEEEVKALSDSPEAFTRTISGLNEWSSAIRARFGAPKQAH